MPLIEKPCESIPHQRAKQSFYEVLRKNKTITALQLEKPIGTIRPDLYYEKYGRGHAIEFQRSDISVGRIEYKNEVYRQHGVYVLWVVVGPPGRTLYKWQKYLRSLYYGKLYGYHSGLHTMVVFEGDKADRYIPRTPFGGGYDKPYKSRYNLTMRNIDYRKLSCTCKESWRHLPAVNILCL